MKVSVVRVSISASGEDAPGMGDQELLLEQCEDATSPCSDAKYQGMIQCALGCGWVVVVLLSRP